MIRLRFFSTFVASLICASCHRAPDPMQVARETCRKLEKSGELKRGISVDECARQLRESEVAADPAHRGQELADQLARAAPANRVAPDPLLAREVREAVVGLKDLGKPAVPAVLRLLKSADPDVRIAAADVLVSTCMADCAGADYSCIGPALMQGLDDSRPQEARAAASIGLSRCTGEDLGADRAAWTAFFESHKAASLSH